MIEAGNDFGPGTAYGKIFLFSSLFCGMDKYFIRHFFFYLGSALIKVGNCEQKLGQIERDFIGMSANCYIQPLRKFLDGEMKTISKEMAILETKR